VILCDVNVLIYAFRSDLDNHPLYKSWIESVINGPRLWHRSAGPRECSSDMHASAHIQDSEFVD
jgi:hypothetical protein